MNGVNGDIAGPGLWQEARNAEGRVYYYNTQTKATQWTKPTELMSAAERALSDQPWKEYTAEGGRKYWYNTETKQSSWEMPEVYKDALAQDFSQQSISAPAPTFVAGGGSFPQQNAHQQYQREEPIGHDRQLGYGNTDVNGSRVFVPSSQAAGPDYASFEEAESAFLKLLRRSGVQPDWSWEEAMRAIIKDSQYRALKDPKDRKAAFEKYAIELRLQEKDRAKERLAKLRADFGTMLRSHPEIKHYTRWKTARPIIEGETIFRSTSDDNERRQLFEEYIIDLKKSSFEYERLQKQSAMDELVAILKALDLEPYTRWADARETIQQNSRFKADEKFRTLSKSDILGAFESHIKALERSFNDTRQQLKTNKARRERQNRDRFMGFLKDLRSGGRIKPSTKWMQLYPLIQDDERYQAMLGQSGSTPQDLFWDMIEEEERGLRSIRNDVVDVMVDKRFELSTNTTLDEFLGVIQHHPRVSQIDRDSLEAIFVKLHEKSLRRSTDAKHDLERQQRHAIDDLRSKIKHLHPPITHTTTWEAVIPRIEKSQEYQALPNDDLRRTAFDKVVRRLREKEDEVDRERSRHSRRDRERSPMDGPKGRRDRDRERERIVYSSRRGGQGRSPEPDAYEADRRKAMADREIRYRKTSTTGLSPPRSARGERDERDRGTRHGSAGKYDIRDRDDGRDYRTSRGGTKDELDYGDNKIGSGDRDKRRRARSGSEASTGRDSKRSRRGDRTPIQTRDRDRSPPRHRRGSPALPNQSLQPPAREEPALHSGSEEGEIEEE